MSTFRSIRSSVRYHTITYPTIRFAKKMGEKLSDKVRQYIRERKLRSQGRKIGIREKVLKTTRGDLARNEGALSKVSMAGRKRRSVLAQEARNLRKYGTRKAPPSAKPSKPGYLDTVSKTRASVLKKTRGQFATNPKLFKKDTISGSKRRSEFAEAARRVKRPVRSRTGDLRKVKGIKAPSSPVGASGQKVAPRPKVPHGSVQAAVNAARTYGHLGILLTGQATRNISANFRAKVLASKKGIPASNQDIRKETADLLRMSRKKNKEGLRKTLKKYKAARVVAAAEHLVSKK